MVSCDYFVTVATLLGGNRFFLGNVHIDIEFEYGDFLELHEDGPAFQYISKLCSLPTDAEEVMHVFQEEALPQAH